MRLCVTLGDVVGSEVVQEEGSGRVACVRAIGVAEGKGGMERLSMKVWKRCRGI